MEIEIYADVVCPWCYVGKRRLEQALESYAGEATVRYRPFQLDPAPVPDPQPLMAALTTKFGGRERVDQMVTQVTRVAADVGLRLNFDRAIAANTFDAHRLVWHATRQGRAAETVDALYRAHFTDGIDIASRPALARVAASAGLDEDAAQALLDSDEGVQEVSAELAAARSLGVSSVPTFVLAGKYAVTGAQEPQTLLAALAEVEQRESAVE